MHHPVVKLSLFSTLVVAVLVACGGSGGGGSSVSVPAVGAVQTITDARYQVVLKDATTGALITDPLVLSFLGSAAVKAADTSSLNGKQVTVTGGLYALAAAFTDGALDFSVQAKDGGNKGWIPTGSKVTGTPGETGDFVVELKLLNQKAAAQINASSSPIGMTAATVNVAANGALTAPVTVTTPTKTVTDSNGATVAVLSSSVSIGAGTVGTTTAGTAAAPGALAVTSTYFSNSSQDSLAQFPGGFAAPVSTSNAAVLNGAAAGSGAFKTAGFAQYSVTDSAGNEIKNFSTPVTLSIDIPRATTDPAGTAITVGGQYPIWSYNESTGAWTFEKLGTVAEKTPVDPNTLAVTFQSSHLSYWSFGWYWPICKTNVTVTGLELNRTAVVSGTEFGYSLSLAVARTDKGDYSTQSFSAFSEAKIKVKVLDWATGATLARQTMSTCAGSVTIPAVYGNIPMGTLRVEASEACPDQTQQRGVPASIYWRRTDTEFGSGTAYTQATSGAVNFGESPVAAGSYVVFTMNPRTNEYDAGTSVTIAAGQRQTVSKKTTMQCKAVTGAG